MIRAIEAKELPQFAELGRAFFKFLELPGEFNADSFCSVWNKLIASGAGFIISRYKENVPQEAIGVIIHPDVYTGDPTACTAFWFFSEEPKGLEAGLLHDALEFDCRHMKLKYLLTGALCDSRLPRVGGYLLRNGYKLVEMFYRKELSCP